jgi:hypothetical protein
MAKKTARSATKPTRHSQLPVQVSTPAGEASAPLGFLIVIELGAQWPTLADALGGAERRVLVQLEGEAPAAFADRVTRSLDTLFGRGVELRRVALACNERVDPAADDARRTLLGLSLGAMAPSHAGQALLTAPPQSSERLRRHLSALAAALRAEWQGAGLDAEADFGREAPSAPTTRSRVA